MKIVAAFLAALAVFVVLVTVSIAFFLPMRPSTTPVPQPTAAITDFETCAQAGYPIMESYPAQCRTPDGQTFIQKTSTTPSPSTSTDDIHINAPRLDLPVPEPLSLLGEARGTWFFEGSFPIRIEDPSGTVIATSHAQAQGEWMTPEFVPFTATIDLPDTFTGPATLILENDNPSGLPENLRSIHFPITIAHPAASR